MGARPAGTGARWTFLLLALSILAAATLTTTSANAIVTTASATGAELRPTAREGATHAVPLFGDLVRTWDAPDDDPFAPGHRGVDVAAEPGTPVRASADGVVSFAGSVAGNRAVTVDHGDGLQTTYSFLGEIRATKGEEVTLGTVIGTVGRGHTTPDLPPHVHLSARRNDRYFDPIELYLGDDLADLLAVVG